MKVIDSLNLQSDMFDEKVIARNRSEEKFYKS